MIFVSSPVFWQKFQKLDGFVLSVKAQDYPGKEIGFFHGVPVYILGESKLKIVEELYKS